MKNSFLKILLYLSVTFLNLALHLSTAIAQSAMTFSFDGVLTTSTDVPVLDTVIFRIGIYNPSENCLLYEETQTLNLTTTNGQFSMAIGSAQGAGKRTANDPNLNMQTVFSNDTTSAVRGPGPNCGSGYTPSSSTDVRQLLIVIEQIGATVVGEPLASQPIRFAPFAQTAHSLQGKGLNEIVTKSVGGGANIPQYGAGGPSTPLAGQIWYDTSAGNFKYFDGVSTLPLTGGGGSGTVTSVSAGMGLLGGPITTTGTLSVDVGTGPGQIVQLNGSSQLPNVSGANLTNLSGAQLTAGTVGNAQLASGSVDSAQLATNSVTSVKISDNSVTSSKIANDNVISSKILDGSVSTADLADNSVTDIKIATGVSGAKISGNISGNSAGFTGALAGDVSGTQGTTSVNRIRGRDVSNTAPSTNEVLKWNGAQWAPSADSVGAGDITSVSAGTGLTGGGLTGDVTIQLNDTAVVPGNYGTSADQTVSFTVNAQGQLTNANQTPIAISAEQIVNSPGQFLRYRPNNISCANSEVLKWNSTLNRWECGVDNAGGAPSWGAITGIPASITQLQSAACSSGQVFQYNAGSWGCGNLPTAGEVNTASNSGVGGVGVFVTKSGMNLEFRNINAASSRVSVINDSANSEIDIDVNQANLSLNSIGGTLNVNKGGTGNTAFSGDSLVMTDSTGSSFISLNSCNDGIIMSDGVSYNCYTLPICSAGELLTYDGVNWDCEFPFIPDATVAAKGVVQVGSGLNVSAGVVSVDVGNSANKIVQLDGSVRLPAVDGSLLTDVNAEAIQGRPVASAPPMPGDTLTWDGAQWRPSLAFDPSTTFSIFNDFVGVADGFGLTNGAYDLAPGLSLYTRATSEADFITPTTADELNRQGIMRMNSGTTAGHSVGIAACQILSGNPSTIAYRQILIGGGTILLETAIRFPSLPNGATIRVGLADILTGTPTKGLYIESTGGNWTFYARGSATTSGDVGAGIAPTAAVWQKIQIVINANATSVDFNIHSGGTLYTSTVNTAVNIPTNIATDALCPLVHLQTTNAASDLMDMDYFSFRQRFNTPR